MKPAVYDVHDNNLFALMIHDTGQLSWDLIEHITRTLDEMEDDKGNESLLLNIVGAPKPKSTPSCWPGKVDMELVSKWEKVLRRIERADFATAAFVKGSCSFLAIELLLITDYRFALSSAGISHISDNRTIWPSMALYRLSRQVGESQARKLLINETSGDALLAELIDLTLDSENEAITRVHDLLSQAPIKDYAVRRRLMQESASMSFDEALGGHLAACHRMLRAQPACDKDKLDSDSI